MSATVKMETVGLKELERKLKDIVPQIRGKKGFAQSPLRTATRKAADVIVEAASQNARRFDDPSTAHRVYEGIGRKPIPVKGRDAFTRRGDSIEGYDIGLKSSSGKYSDITTRKTRYANTYWQGIFQELGTDKQPAQPFLRPALESKKYIAIDVFKTSLDKSLQAIVKKLNRQSKIR